MPIRPVALTTRHPLSAKGGTNLVDDRRTKATEFSCFFFLVFHATNYIKRIHWEAKNRSADRLLWIPKAYYHVHSMSPVRSHTSSSISGEVYAILTSPLRVTRPFARHPLSFGHFNICWMTLYMKQFSRAFCYTRSRGNSVRIAMDYGLEGRILISGRSKKFVSAPQCPDWFSYTMGTGGSVPMENRPGGEADHFLHLVPRSKMIELHRHTTKHLHGVVLKLLSTRITLPFYCFVPHKSRYSTRPTVLKHFQSVLFP
jgi:hypothetical protein